MNLLSLVCLSAPNDLWTIIINWIQNTILNYGWTIILFTIIVKLVLTPLDFGVKYTTKKQTLIQKKCAPQIAKLQKKYGNDANTIKIQTNSLYKREGMKMGVGCIVMLVNMVLTMVIFFTLYSSLRKISAYEAVSQYEQVQASYTSTFYGELIDKSSEVSTEEEAKKFIEQYDEYKKFVDSATEEDKADPAKEYETKSKFVNDNGDMLEEISRTALKAARETWQNVKSSWLWIDNIWVADSPTNPFPNYDSLLSLANNGGYGDYVRQNISKDLCDRLAANVAKDDNKNGYYILAILAGIVTFLSQYIAELSNNLKNKKANSLAKSSEKAAGGMSMKMMKIIMPIIMVVFVLTTSAAFGIYILASNIASIVFGSICTLIIDRVTKSKREEVEEFLEKEANRMIKKGYMQEKR